MDVPASLGEMKVIHRCGWVNVCFFHQCPEKRGFRNADRLKKQDTRQLLRSPESEIPMLPDLILEIGFLLLMAIIAPSLAK